MSQIDGAIEQCLAEAQYYASLRVALDMVVRTIEGKYESPPGVKDAHKVLASELFEKENDAYRRYFMFALDATEEVQAEARKMAYERYMKEGMIVMDYLRWPCSLPNVWHDVDEEQFRRDLEHFKGEE